MRIWLGILTAVVAAVALGYVLLDSRVGRLERKAAEWTPAAAGREARPAVATRRVTVYFARVRAQDVEVVPVQRTVPAEAPAAAALRALLEGPTPEEQARGLHSEIPPGVRLEGVTVENGTARAAFSPELDRGVAGSSRVIAIRRQIEETLRQFSGVRQVVIEVDGRVDDVLQP